MSKRVYGYCRVSTIGQALDGDSLDVQEEKIKEYCKFKNLEIITIYKEGGISGAIPPHQRPLMKIILANLEAKQGDGLVVCKIDRLSRSTKDFINLMADFKDKFHFYSIAPDMDSSTTMGQFTMNLLSNVAELELNMTKDRVKEIITSKKAKGELIGAIPFGKRLKANTNLLEDDEEEQKTINIVKELRNTYIPKLVNGKEVMKKMTYDKICKELQDRGRKNKDGVPKFYPSQIRRMLNDGSYKSGKVKRDKIIIKK